MSIIEIHEAIKSSAPSKGSCELCKASLEKLASVSASKKVLFKTVSVRLCILCAKEFLAVVGMRVGQAERGEYQP